MFNSVAVEDVYNCSIIQQCRMLEATCGTTVLAKCLNDSENSMQIILENKEELLKKRFKNLLCSVKGSAKLAACIASRISWRWLWDMALERGIKGTRAVQSLFWEVCRPASSFECVLCRSCVP